MFMKKMLLLMMSAGLLLAAQAQNEKYVGYMKKTIAQLDSARTPDDFQQAANTFERIANAEKTEWQPGYYGAYALVMKAFYMKELKEVDATCDKADAMLALAESIAGMKNSEILTLKSMVLTARMRVDGSRGMSMGPKATQLLQQALQGQPASNPRAMVQMAQMLFYTPPAFGGGKEAGIEWLKKGIAAYETFKPATDLDPIWGKPYAEGLLQQWTAGK